MPSLRCRQFVPLVSRPCSAPASLSIDVYATAGLAAEAAAADAAIALRLCLARRGEARIMVGTGNSQLEMIRALTRQPDIDWQKVDAFHLDEYVGIAADHPASFRRWIRHNFEQAVRPRSVSYIEGDAADLAAMLEDYSRRLLASPIDLAFVGIGENGHIAFNDPHVADFNDPAIVKRVELDAACRRQQVGEGHFPDLDHVPCEAISVTCPGLFRAARWICCVPDRRKASAIHGSLEGPVSTQCPGSLVRKHPSVGLYLDQESASLLPADYVRANCRLHNSDTSANASTNGM